MGKLSLMQTILLQGANKDCSKKNFKDYARRIANQSYNDVDDDVPNVRTINFESPIPRIFRYSGRARYTVRDNLLGTPNLKGVTPRKNRMVHRFRYVHVPAHHAINRRRKDCYSMLNAKANYLFQHGNKNVDVLYKCVSVNCQKPVLDKFLGKDAGMEQKYEFLQQIRMLNTTHDHAERVQQLNDMKVDSLRRFDKHPIKRRSSYHAHSSTLKKISDNKSAELDQEPEPSNEPDTSSFYRKRALSTPKIKTPYSVERVIITENPEFADWNSQKVNALKPAFVNLKPSIYDKAALESKQCEEKSLVAESAVPWDNVKIGAHLKGKIWHSLRISPVMRQLERPRLTEERIVEESAKMDECLCKERDGE